MKTYIILVKCNEINREDMKRIEGKLYGFYNHVRILDDPDLESVMIYTLSEFMDAFNNEEIPHDFWMTYVHILNEERKYHENYSRRN